MDFEKIDAGEVTSSPPRGTLCQLKCDVDAYVEPAKRTKEDDSFDDDVDTFGPQISLQGRSFAVTLSAFNIYRELHVLTSEGICWVPASLIKIVDE